MRDEDKGKLRKKQQIILTGATSLMLACTFPHLKSGWRLVDSKAINTHRRRKLEELIKQTIAKD